MTIAFPPDELPLLSHGGNLIFTAVEDSGKIIPCGISFEALREHFGAKAINSHDMYRAFNGNRAAIHKKASEALALNGGNSILLMRDHF
ncbi:MAG: DUF1488 family protein [Burkholderiaceae bacterium]|jgi:hypothetical protein